jgi:large repetitive protein
MTTRRSRRIALPSALIAVPWVLCLLPSARAQTPLSHGPFPIVEAESGLAIGTTSAGAERLTLTCDAQLAPAPTVTAVSPANGPVAGGTPVTIDGAGFLNGAGVTFGGTAATNVMVLSTGRITATTPAHGAGAVDLVVTNATGQASPRFRGFTYSTVPKAPVGLRIVPPSRR